MGLSERNRGVGGNEMASPDQCRLRVGERRRRKEYCVCVLVCRGCLESSLRIPAIDKTGNLQETEGTREHSEVLCTIRMRQLQVPGASCHNT